MKRENGIDSREILHTSCEHLHILVHIKQKFGVDCLVGEASYTSAVSCTWKRKDVLDHKIGSASLVLEHLGHARYRAALSPWRSGSVRSASCKHEGTMQGLKS